MFITLKSATYISLHVGKRYNYISCSKEFVYGTLDVDYICVTIILIINSAQLKFISQYV